MDTPPDPSTPVRGSGFDDAHETERRWSSVTPTPEEADGTRVTVEYVVVEGEDAQILVRRQAIAIRGVLAWLHEHPARDGT